MTPWAHGWIRCFEMHCLSSGKTILPVLWFICVPKWRGDIYLGPRNEFFVSFEPEDIKWKLPSKSSFKDFYWYLRKQLYGENKNSANVFLKLILEDQLFYKGKWFPSTAYWTSTFCFFFFSLQRDFVCLFYQWLLLVFVCLGWLGFLCVCFVSFLPCFKKRNYSHAQKLL